MDIEKTNKSRVITLGNFDGVHIGHSALLNKLSELKRQSDALDLVTVITFSAHTRLGSNGFCCLYPNDINDYLLRLSGVDEIIRLDFQAVRQYTPELFVKLITEKYNPQAVVCGDSFRFGYQAQGDAAYLSAELSKHGIKTFIIDSLRNANQAISTTAIKKLVERGDVAQAERLLGRRYFIRSVVSAGKGLGRRIGAATLNQSLYSGCVAPAYGVYASLISTAEGVFKGVTNIGCRPTVDNDGIPNCETHLFDYNGNLYRQAVTTELVCFIRKEKKFGSVRELSEAINADKAAALEQLADKKPTIVRS